MMRIVKIGLMGILGLSVLSGCGTPSKSKEVSVKSTSAKSQQPIVKTKASSVAMLNNIAKESVPDKPGVTRVIITLDKKASYSTSREGNRLIVNVFSAKMKSSMKQIEVQDPVVRSITAKQVGNSVKSVVELMNQDVAYRPSTSTDPFQILVDIWQISPETALMQPSGKEEMTIIDTSSDAQRTKEITLDIRKSPEGGIEKEPLLDVTTAAPPTQDVPARLQWFSEKLSQVLQERERLKQELLDAEKSFAVKDSMIQVLERKVKEANTRIVELEEELIKARSTTSLAEQNERDLQDVLNQVLAQLEKSSGEQIAPASESLQKEQIQDRSEKIAARILALKQELSELGEAKNKVEELQTQVASLTQERDGFKTQAGTCTAEVTTLKENVAKFSAFERELRVKEAELARLREAVGAAAQLVVGRPGEVPVTTVHPVQPDVQIVTAETTEESQSTVQVVEGVEEQTDSQLVLADLIQQQQLLTVSPEDYVLGPEDVVQIKVLKEENLDKTVTVSSDGFITYPLLGDLRVDGLTTAQVDAQITSLLARDFLVDPEVIVEVVSQRSKKVYIMGLVKQPGYHEISEDQRLLGTLLNAGGPTDFNTEVRVLRLPKGDIVSDEPTDTVAPIVVNLQKLFVEGDQTQNVVLRDGDVLMVAAKSPSSSGTNLSLGPQQFYVVGSVVNPGIYTYKQNDTVLDAVLRAGGFTEFASRNGTKLVRETEGKTRTFRIKMKDVMEKGDMDQNMNIMPGDMIIVPESFF